MKRILCAAAALLFSTVAHSQADSDSNELPTLTSEQHAMVDYANTHYTIDITRPDGTTLTPSDPEFQLTVSNVGACNYAVLGALHKGLILTGEKVASVKLRCLQDLSENSGLNLVITLTPR